MTRYKLPDGLAAELDVLSDQNPTRYVGNYIWVRHDKLGVVQLDRTRLAKVLPPEPSDRTHMGCNGYVFTRRDATATARLEPYRRWFDGPGDGMTWAEVVEYSETHKSPLVRLVPDPADDVPDVTVLHLSDPGDTLKMIRETLCVAQQAVGGRHDHSDRIQRMINEIDRQRPLGADGKHGNGFRCTPTCGCEPRAAREVEQP